MKHAIFPSLFDLHEHVLLRFKESQTDIDAYIIGVHFYEGKVKYDLSIRIDDNSYTRVYNVDSYFVRAAERLE